MKYWTDVVLVAVAAMLVWGSEAHAQGAADREVEPIVEPARQDEGLRFEAARGMAGGTQTGRTRRLLRPGETTRKAGRTGTPSPRADAEIVRRRLAVLTFDPVRTTDPDPGTRVVLDLFDDRQVEVAIDRVTRRRADSYTWYGHTTGPGIGTMVLVVESGVLAANLSGAWGVSYEIRSAGGNTYVISEIRESGEARCGVTDRHKARTINAAGVTNAGAKAGQPVMDVLVVYTPAALQAVGGGSAMKALIRLAVETSNLAYFGSEINASLRLAGWGEVSYDETGAAHSQHLDRLTDPNDGFLDEANELRGELGADLVALLVDDTDPVVGGSGQIRQTFGIAWLAGGPADGDLAFSTIDQGFAASAGNWTFAHELGHNMGCAHDAGDAGGIFGYSIGHSFQGNSGTFWQTVMVRRAVGGTRIQRFSNPNVTFDGQPTGVAAGDSGAADNARTIDSTSFNVAAWRSALPLDVYVDFLHVGFELGTALNPFNTLTEGLAACHWDGTLWIDAGSTPTGIRIDRTITLRAVGGPVTIGR